MPTYEFRCPKGHKFTHFYKTMSTAPSQLPCGECGAVAERQLSGGAGFAFKGSGFYLTDYGKNAHRGGEKVTSATEPASSAGGDKKPDSPSASAPAKTEGAKSDSGKKADSSKPK